METAAPFDIDNFLSLLKTKKSSNLTLCEYDMRAVQTVRAFLEKLFPIGSVIFGWEQMTFIQSALPDSIWDLRSGYLYGCPESLDHVYDKLPSFDFAPSPFPHDHKYKVVDVKVNDADLYKQGIDMYTPLYKNGEGGEDGTIESGMEDKTEWSNLPNVFPEAVTIAVYERLL